MYLFFFPRLLSLYLPYSPLPLPLYSSILLHPAILSSQRVTHPGPGLLADLSVINSSVYISPSCLLPLHPLPPLPSLSILLHPLPFIHSPDRLIHLLLLPSSAAPCPLLFPTDLIWSHCADIIVAHRAQRVFFSPLIQQLSLLRGSTFPFPLDHLLILSKFFL